MPDGSGAVCASAVVREAVLDSAVGEEFAPRRSPPVVAASLCATTLRSCSVSSTWRAYPAWASCAVCSRAPTIRWCGATTSSWCEVIRLPSGYATATSARTEPSGPGWHPRGSHGRDLPPGSDDLVALVADEFGRKHVDRAFGGCVQQRVELGGGAARGVDSAAWRVFRAFGCQCRLIAAGSGSATRVRIGGERPATAPRE